MDPRARRTITLVSLLPPCPRRQGFPPSAMPPAPGFQGHPRQVFRDTCHTPGARCSRDTSLHATEIRRWNVSLRVPQIRQAPTECASTPGTKNLLHTLALVLASRAGTRVGAFARRARARRACARLRVTRACASRAHIARLRPLRAARARRGTRPASRVTRPACATRHA